MAKRGNQTSHHAVLAELIPSDHPRHSEGVDLGWRIVVIDRGWVVVGKVTDFGSNMIVHHCRCLRTWGTSRGLGELISGPTSETKHDEMGIVDVPMRAVIFTMPVAEDAWSFPFAD